MAHHLGMSLCAITNTLLDDLLPRRFLSDPAMAAYQGLLQEKVPLGGLLLRRRDGRVPVRPRARVPGSVSGRGRVWIPFARPVPPCPTGYTA